MPIQGDFGPCKLMLGTDDGNLIPLGTPTNIDVERYYDDNVSASSTVSIKCNMSNPSANDLIRALQIAEIRRWCGGTLAYTPASSRWLKNKDNPMQVFPSKVICNPPATIAFWDDGTKTIAKTSESRYDPYVGLLCCIVKHVGASALHDGESVNGKLNRILVDAGMRYQVPSKFGKHWITKEFQRFTVTTPNGKCKEKWIEVAGTES